MKPKENIDRDERIKKYYASHKPANVININGFPFFIESEDIDFYVAVCIMPWTRENWQKAWTLKKEHEQDFVYDERDCTGSTRVCVSVKRYKYNKWYRMHNVIVIRYHCSVDV